MVRRRQIEKRTDIWHQLDGDNAKSVAAQCNIRIIRVEEVRAVKCSVSADLERATAHWWSQSAAFVRVSVDPAVTSWQMPVLSRQPTGQRLNCAGISIFAGPTE